MKNKVWVAAAGCLCLVMGLAWPAFSQEGDAEGCQDHPMLSRMKGFIISGCEQNFDSVEFYIGDDQTRNIEGDKILIEYTLAEGTRAPSELQIKRNYSNAVKTLGGEVVYESDTYISLKLVKGGREYWISVETYNNGSDYTLTVLVLGEMAQEVTASDMQAALDRDGFMALYIQFDTGRAEIRPESQPTIDRIVEVLEANPELKLSIEGHTDNVGDAASNKLLSENRAKAVMEAVTAQGVDPTRLSAVGWGQEKPVADNRTEDGRAKNRRVEIVKKG